MELQQLRYVLLLSEELNFHRAARAAHVTQPTLSQQVAKLEKELGVYLFERGTKSIRITKEGEAFLPYIRLLFENLKQGVQEIKKEKGVLEGSIRLGFIPTIGPYFMPYLLKTLKKEAPMIQVQMFEETTSVLLESLHSGKLDLALLALPIEESGIVEYKICSDEFLLAVHKSHKLAKKKKVSFKDIEEDELLILQEGHCFRDQALEFCHKYFKKIDYKFEGSSLVSVLNLVSVNEGMTFIPKMALPFSKHPNLVFKEFSPGKPKREIGLCWRVTYPLNYVEKYFLELCKKISS